jgi:hypothetical protein
MIKPDPTNQKAFIDRIDSDVVSAFALFLEKVLQINPEVFARSRHLTEIVNLYV